MRIHTLQREQCVRRSKAARWINRCWTFAECKAATVKVEPGKLGHQRLLAQIDRTASSVEDIDEGRMRCRCDQDGADFKRPGFKESPYYEPALRGE